MLYFLPKHDPTEASVWLYPWPFAEEIYMPTVLCCTVPWTEFKQTPRAPLRDISVTYYAPCIPHGQVPIWCLCLQAVWAVFSKWTPRPFIIWHVRKTGEGERDLFFCMVAKLQRLSVNASLAAASNPSPTKLMHPPSPPSILHSSFTPHIHFFFAPQRQKPDVSCWK